MSLSLAEIQRERLRGQEMAELEQSVNGDQPHYLLIAFPVYPNGTTGDPVQDPEIAKQVGFRAGIGDPTDEAGFGIWDVDQIEARRIDTLRFLQ